MNTTTWIFDGQDKISSIMNKVHSTFSNTMSSVKKATQSAATVQKDLETKIKSVSTSLDAAKIKMSNSFSPKQIKETTAEVKRLETELHDLKNIPVGQGINNALVPVQNSIGGIGRMLGGLFIADRLKQFGGSVIDITGEFQKYEAVLTNTFQSHDKAVASMQMLQKFAASTPFQLNELTDSYVKMVNRGFEPTSTEMTKLGDLASSTGKSFDQLTEAILDAQTGEFERLKEFGIQASKNGDKVTISFKGMKKEVANTPDAINAAMLGFGAMQGVSGSMSSIMGTLQGQISNMGDAWDAFKVKIGSGESPLLSKIIDGITKVIQLATSHLDTVVALIKSVAIALAIAGTAFLYTTFTVGGFTAVLELLNLTFLMSPWFWVVAGIAAVIFAITQAWKKFEGFRAFVYSLWGTIKTVFTSMWDVVKNFFGGLADMVSAIVNGDWSGFKEGAKRFGKAVVGATPIGFVAEYGGDIANGAKKGWQNGKDSFQKDKQKQTAKSPLDIITDKKKPMATLPIGNNSKNKSGSDGSSSNQMRNVTVTIKQLIGSININSTTIGQSLGNVKQQVVETIVAAVRDSEVAIAQ